MNETTRKTAIAVVLNLILPGSGYMYLKTKNRLWIAIPLLIWAIYQISYTYFVLFINSHYRLDRNLSPFTSTGMVNINVYSWFVLLIMSIDTWDIARKLRLNNRNTTAVRNA